MVHTPTAWRQDVHLRVRPLGLVLFEARHLRLHELVVRRQLLLRAALCAQGVSGEYTWARFEHVLLRFAAALAAAVVGVFAGAAFAVAVLAIVSVGCMRCRRGHKYARHAQTTEGATNQ